MISLYGDQEEFVTEIRSLWRSHLRIVGYAQTGFGKTRVAARIIEGFSSRGLRVCFVVPRITLIQQTAKSFIDLGLEDITLQWGDSETDERALITISSIDTMIRRPKRKYDLVIVDECHKRREQLLRWMVEFPDERYLGLSATPFANWMGEYYTGLAKSKPMRWLIDNDRLSEYEIYAPSVPDLSEVSSRNTAMGYDYAESELEAVMGDFKVIGNIVQNWLEHGDNRLTMALCVNVSHANHLMLEFQKAGVSAETITAKTKIEERERIFQRSKEGITRVVLSVDCLTEGYDQPEMTCLINARPTKSLMRYAQGMGRVLRYLEGKVAVIFDHSGTSIELGFPEDITISELRSGNDGESKDNDREPEEKREKKAKKCASCNFLKPAGVYVCPKCGFKPVVGEDVETDESRGLKKVKGKKKVFTTEDKQLWYSQFLGFQKERQAEGKKASDGYISHLYKAKFGVWPRGLSSKSIGAGPEVRRYIKSRQIAYAKGLKSENNRSNQGK
jgi:superfamily II DNA or RNA helicase